MPLPTSAGTLLGRGTWLSHTVKPAGQVVYLWVASRVWFEVQQCNNTSGTDSSVVCLNRATVIMR